MDPPCERGGVLVFVAGVAKRRRAGSDQLYSGDIPIHPNLMATQTATFHRGMHRLAFGLVGVALKTFCRIGVGFEAGMLGCAQALSRGTCQEEGHKDDFKSMLGLVSQSNYERARRQTHYPHT